MVDSPSWGVVTLKSVAKREISGFIYAYSSTSFSPKAILFIFNIHHFLRERALYKVKIERIKGN